MDEIGAIAFQDKRDKVNYNRPACLNLSKKNVFGSPMDTLLTMAQFLLKSNLHSLLKLATPIPSAPVACRQPKGKEDTVPVLFPMQAANRSDSAT